MILAKTKEEIKNDYLKRLTFTFAEDISQATLEHKYFALGKLIKDYLTEKWAETNKIYKERKVKQTYYFSMEFLIGRLLETNLINLGIRDLCEEALKELGIDFNELVSYEEDAGLRKRRSRKTCCLFHRFNGISITTSSRKWNSF